MGKGGGPPHNFSGHDFGGSLDFSLGRGFTGKKWGGWGTFSGGKIAFQVQPQRPGRSRIDIPPVEFVASGWGWSGGRKREFDRIFNWIPQNISLGGMSRAFGL